MSFLNYLGTLGFAWVVISFFLKKKPPCWGEQRCVLEGRMAPEDAHLLVPRPGIKFVFTAEVALQMSQR